MKNNFIAKKNYLLSFSFILLAIINFMYVAAEINKPHVLKSMGYDSAHSSVYQVSLAEVERITAVSNFSLHLERAFIIISLLLLIFLLTKKVRLLFTKLLIITFCFYSLLFIINIGLAVIFKAPYINLIQLLLLPFLFLILVRTYGLVKFRNPI